MCVSMCVYVCLCVSMCLCVCAGPPLPPRQGLAPEAGDQVYTAPRPPPRKPPLAPRTAPRPAGLPDPSMMSSPTFGSSVPTFAGADAAMSNTYSQPVAEGEGFVCDQCGKAYVTPTGMLLFHSHMRRCLIANLML